MIWLTWRQHRGQFLFVLALLAVIAAVVVPIGLRLHSAFHEMGVADCTSNLSPAVLDGSSDATGAAIECGRLAEEFMFVHGSQGFIGLFLLVLVPLAFGVVIGTQLVADDVDHGTHRLVWTQGVTRNRWWMTKLGLAGVTATIFAAVYGFLGYWFMVPIIRSGTGRIFLSDMLGATPIAYALFAVALGAFTGAMWRKAPPAIAATLFGFIVARLAVRSIRPGFLTPLERKLKVQWDPAEIESGRPYWLRLNGDLEVGAAEHGPSGQVVSETGMRFCPSVPPEPPATPAPHDLACLDPGFPKVDHNLMLYHPDSRFWTFQLIEVAIFLGLTIVLVILTARRVSRLI